MGERKGWLERERDETSVLLVLFLWERKGWLERERDETSVLLVLFLWEREKDG